MKTFKIYTLTDPRDGDIRYIGMSTCPERRFQGHLNTNGVFPNERKKRWVRELQAHHLRPILSVIEMVETRESALLRERYWILYHQKQGARLLNAALP